MNNSRVQASIDWFDVCDQRTWHISQLDIYKSCCIRLNKISAILINHFIFVCVRAIFGISSTYTSIVSERENDLRIAWLLKRRRKKISSVQNVSCNQRHLWIWVVWLNFRCLNTANSKTPKITKISQLTSSTLIACYNSKICFSRRNAFLMQKFNDLETSQIKLL